mmetsp:Transcript_14981/g.45352  ORF Transcript_14981/g.45352 Transcript_14981/m.45352 type:complete len:289 (-) Transcript_14981:101-967(-)
MSCKRVRSVNCGGEVVVPGSAEAGVVPAVPEVEVGCGGEDGAGSAGEGEVVLVGEAGEGGEEEDADGFAGFEERAEEVGEDGGSGHLVGGVREVEAALAAVGQRDGLDYVASEGASLEVDEAVAVRRRALGKGGDGPGSIASSEGHTQGVARGGALAAVDADDTEGAQDAAHARHVAEAGARHEGHGAESGHEGEAVVRGHVVRHHHRRAVHVGGVPRALEAKAHDAQHEARRPAGEAPEQPVASGTATGEPPVRSRHHPAPAERRHRQPHAARHQHHTGPVQRSEGP